MEFWVRERSLVELIFVRKICNSNQEIVKKRFFNRRLSDKEGLWDKELLFDSLS